MKKLAVTVTILMLAGIIRADIESGWCQTETNGTGEKKVETVQFFESNNWVDGIVNGVYGAGLPALFQLVQMTDDYRGTFNFAYTGDYTTMTFMSNTTTPRWIYLTDDFRFGPSVQKGKVTFGNADTRKTVNFDLGGVTRTFIVSGSQLNFNSQFVNGDLRLVGNGGTMNLVGPGVISGDVSIGTNMTLLVGYQTSDAQRLGNVTLNRATLDFEKPNGNYTDTIGTLTVTGDEGSASVLKLAPNGKTMTVQMKALDLAPGALLSVMPTDLGTSSIVKFQEVPETVNGLLPGLVVGASPTAQINGTVSGKESYSAISFAMYDEETGLSAMSDDDYAASISSEDDVDLRIAPGATVTVEENASVNSLVLNVTTYRDASAVISGGGRLAVKSGMVLGVGVKTGAKIDVALDFEDRPGYIVAAGPNSVSVDVTKPIHGTKGVTLTKLLATSVDLQTAMSSSLQGITITTTEDEGTYTGDTYVQGPVKVGSSPFLPHGARSGNVIVNAWLGFGSIAINGLFGKGKVEGTQLTVGSDGSDSAFGGTVEVSALDLAGGVFILNGEVAKGVVTVGANAGLGGTGTVKSSVAFTDGGRLVAVPTDGVLPTLTVEGTVTGPIAVSVAPGKWKSPQCLLKSTSSMTNVSFVKAEGSNHLGAQLREDGTELWVFPKSGFQIVVR